MCLLQVVSWRGWQTPKTTHPRSPFLIHLCTTHPVFLGKWDEADEPPPAPLPRINAVELVKMLFVTKSCSPGLSWTIRMMIPSLSILPAMFLLAGTGLWKKCQYGVCDGSDNKAITLFKNPKEQQNCTISGSCWASAEPALSITTSDSPEAKGSEVFKNWIRPNTHLI